MSKLLGSIVALLAVLALAALTNPSAERHRERIKEAVGERSQVQKVLGVGALKAFAADYHNLVLFSYAKVGDEMVSVGAFGLVVVID